MKINYIKKKRINESYHEEVTETYLPGENIMVKANEVDYVTDYIQNLIDDGVIQGEYEIARSYDVIPAVLYPVDNARPEEIDNDTIDDIAVRKDFDRIKDQYIKKLLTDEFEAFCEKL